MADILKLKWKDLEAQGIKRCCAHFKDGTRCRRRAAEEFRFEWCGKHGPVLDRIIKETTDMLKRTGEML